MTTPLRTALRCGLAALCLLTTGGTAFAAGCSNDGPRGGPLGIDHCDEFEAHGLMARRNQLLLDALIIGGSVGTALWEGTESPAGRVAWQAVDSMVTTAVVTETMKRVFQRPRPSQSDDPNLWRQGGSYKSFPSGETAMVAAFVTPVILAYHEEHPAVWALAGLPVYMGAARMASHGHWLSDVLVGGAVGATSGWLATQRDSPLVLAPLNGGVFVGLRYRF